MKCPTRMFPIIEGCELTPYRFKVLCVCVMLDGVMRETGKPGIIDNKKAVAEAMRKGIEAGYGGPTNAEYHEILDMLESGAELPDERIWETN